jgi:hypothetical protein
MTEGNGRAPVTADAILDVEDVELLEVATPEWKNCPTVWLRTLPGDEGAELWDQVAVLQAQIGGKTPAPGTSLKARMLLLAASIVDARGVRLFTTPEQIEKLSKRQHKVLVRLEQAALRLQGWAPEGGPKAASDEAALAASPTA